MADAYKFTMDMTKVLGAPEEDKSNGLMTSLRPKKRPTPADPQVAAKPKADGVQPTAMTKLDTLKSDFARIAIETQGEEEINKLYSKQWDKSPTTFDRIRTNLLDRWGADTTVAPSPPRDTPAKPQMERPKRPYMLDASNMPDIPSIIDDVPVADAGEGLMSDPRKLGGSEGYGSFGVSNTTAPDRGLIPALSSNVVFSDPEMSFIVALEQFREKPYELNSNTNLSPTEHKSGLTIANGFDAGQHTKKVLEDMGLSTTTINKFSEWIGVNPDTIIDPITNAPAATRVRGHELMAEKFESAKANGTLPELTYKELEEVSKGSYDTLGTQVAKTAYGAGFEQLDDDVKAVLTQEAYVRGKINQTSIDRARNGEDALRVLDAMPSTGHLAKRKSNVRSWLGSNTFSDDKALSNQGVQMLTNIIIEDMDLQTTPLTVDSLVGPATRRTVNEVIRAAGKTPPSVGSTGDAKRKSLLEEIANESLLPTATTS